MRLLMDMQALQGVSRLRGLGRYSLNLAIGLHQADPQLELNLLLHGGGDAQQLAELRCELAGLVPTARVVTFDAPWPWTRGDASRVANHLGAEAVREALIGQIDPDVVLIGSLFEGADESVISVSGRPSPPDGRPRPFTAVVGYDVLPLTDPTCRPAEGLPELYQHRLDSLCHADLVLSISDYSTSQFQEALGDRLPQIRTIWGAAVPMTADVAPQRRGVLCAGGDSPRKNERATVAAYAQLPAAIRQADPLTVAGRRRDSEVAALWQYARDHGLSERDFRVVGAEVTDRQLANQYRSARLVVMPSLGEGLGLPVLEAWSLGAPAIASSTTSLGELVGDDRFTFDPLDIPGQAELLGRCLSDPDFLAAATEHGQQRLPDFTWEVVARRALHFIEQARAALPAPPASPDRPRLAFHSPWPPQATGIARHAEAVLPELRADYEVTLVNDDPAARLAAQSLGVATIDTPTFLGRAGHFDRVVYNMGNNRDFHSLSAHAMSRVPGVVVMHDPDLIGLIRACEPPLPVNETCQRVNESGLAGLSWDRPVGVDLLRTARGVIVHSDTAKRHYAEVEVRPLPAERVHIAPLALLSLGQPDRRRARELLGIPESTVVVCSFGRVFREKRVATAWEAVERLAAQGADVMFRAVGHADPGYAAELLESRDQNIGALTGALDNNDYEMWLSAADIAIQLRATSRGETSGALVEALAFGCTVLAEDLGSFAEFAQYGVQLVPSPAQVDDLASRLGELLAAGLDAPDPQAFRDIHGGPAVATRYRDIIEASYASAAPPRLREPDLAIWAARNAARLQNVRPSVYWANAGDWRRRNARATDWCDQLLGGLVDRDRARVLPVIPSPQDPAQPGQLPVQADLELLASMSRPDRVADLQSLALPVYPAPGDWLVVSQWRPLELSAGSVARWKALGGRIATIVGDAGPLEYPEICTQTTVPSLPWLTRVLKASDVIVASSEAGLAAVLAAAGTAAAGRDLPAIVIPPGCDVVPRRPPAVQLQGRQLGASTLLAMASDEPRGALPMLIDACARVRNSGHPLNLVLIADSHWSGREVPEFVRIVVHPTLDELRWEYLNADLVVDPCRVAADSMVVREAIAHGCTVLARDLPVHREVFGLAPDLSEHPALFRLDGELPDRIAVALRAPRNYEPPSRLASWEAATAALVSALDLSA